MIDSSWMQLYMCLTPLCLHPRVLCAVCRRVCKALWRRQHASLTIGGQFWQRGMNEHEELSRACSGAILQAGKNLSLVTTPEYGDMQEQRRGSKCGIDTKTAILHPLTRYRRSWATTPWKEPQWWGFGRAWDQNLYHSIFIFTISLGYCLLRKRHAWTVGA